MPTTIVFTGLLAAGGVVLLVWLAIAITRHVRRGRLLHNLWCRERALVDSASNRALVSAAQRSFGRRLRDHRERRQITLAAMATATKIKPSVFEELERGDVSTWPCGIFRRAFVRAYGMAIGLPPEPLIEEFVQLFPESGAGDKVAAPSNELRLTLASDPWRRMIATRVLVALIEAGSIAAIAWLTARISATSYWSACAVIAMMYYALSIACLGRSPASWYHQNGLALFRQRRPNLGSPSPDTREWLHLVDRRERPEELTHEDSDSAASTPPLRAASR
jgi:transcriptional regulator with XRE-family HTH domain